jgi:integrase
MASIQKIGSGWRALIRRKGHPSYCRTFRVKAQAEAWARQVESDIDRGQVRPAAVLGRKLLLGDLVQAYRELRDKARPISDSSNEHYMLKHLDAGLGERDALTLTPQDLVGYCTARKEKGAGPYTCNMEISKLGTAMRYAAVALKTTVPDVVSAARPLLNQLGLIGGGGRRERRPTEDELQAVVRELAQKRGALYADVVRFAVATAMRRSEIARLRWADIDEGKRLVLVRDRKDPRRKAGNDQWVPLLGEAWTIVKQQPRAGENERIFPIHESTMSKYFTWACRELGIPDLHFHDLRHDGTSRLFEQGYHVQQVALVTGHKDWRHLRRYILAGQ